MEWYCTECGGLNKRLFYECEHCFAPNPLAQPPPENNVRNRVHVAARRPRGSRTLILEELKVPSLEPYAQETYQAHGPPSNKPSWWCPRCESELTGAIDACPYCRTPNPLTTGIVYRPIPIDTESRRKQEEMYKRGAMHNSLRDPTYAARRLAAEAAAAAAPVAPVQRHYPSFHPHLLNRVSMPYGRKICDSCNQLITAPLSWRCANGCDVDLCDVCEAREAAAAPVAAAAAAANQEANDPDVVAALAASRVNAAAINAAAAANNQGLAAGIAASIASASAAPVASSASSAAAQNEPGSVENEAARRRLNREMRARTLERGLAAAAQAASKNKKEPGAPGGGTRRRTRHTKNKTGRKCRTYIARR